MSEELKPCPYCKGTYTCIQNVQTGGHQATCCCGMTGPIMATEQEAVESWNALPRRSDIERVERERDWLIDYMLKKGICYYTDEAKKYCQSQDDCDDCPYVGGEAWLKAIKEATCPKN